ncbi:MAG TPA: hypothetical protein VL984_15570 [Acidimicrobiales bacterium]|nr:hypothetical protein [Acidimicrobiales bacterium]
MLVVGATEELGPEGKVVGTVVDEVLVVDEALNPAAEGGSVVLVATGAVVAGAPAPAVAGSVVVVGAAPPPVTGCVAAVYGAVVTVGVVAAAVVGSAGAVVGSAGAVVGSSLKPVPVRAPEGDVVDGADVEAVPPAPLYEGAVVTGTVVEGEMDEPAPAPAPSPAGLEETELGLDVGVLGLEVTAPGLETAVVAEELPKDEPAELPPAPPSGPAPAALDVPGVLVDETAPRAPEPDDVVGAPTPAVLGPAELLDPGDVVPVLPSGELPELVGGLTAWMYSLPAPIGPVEKCPVPVTARPPCPATV